MAIYGPWKNLDLAAQPDGQGARPALPGFYCITDHATLAAKSDLLTPYVVTGGAVQHVLGGDTANDPQVTVTLHFADMVTAQEVMAHVNAPGPAEPSPLPDEVPMWRIKAMLDLRGVTSAVLAYINGLPNPTKTVALAAWGGAPDLVVRGSLALAIKGALSYSSGDYELFIAQAVNLSL